LNIETIGLADKGRPVILEKPDLDISMAVMDVIGKIQNILAM
jgi:hypothetical protein